MDSNTSISDLMNLIMGAQNTTQPVYPAGSFDVTPFKEFYDKAYIQLAPYYKQLLDEAGGDLSVALTNLEKDYQIGKRTTIEDFGATMEKLGVVLPKEQQQLQGTLNQRGIALTENPQGQTTYAGGGQAKTESDILNEDQKLRAEAVQRTRQRGLESAAFSKLAGGESAQQGYRNTTEAQQKEHETSATNLGSQFQQADIAQKEAGRMKAETDAKTGGGTTSRPNVNPKDANSIKAGYKGYASWNDLQSIINDFAATGGAGKE